jgi:ornithine cyclodeaminase/alanine dehydrogenase
MSDLLVLSRSDLRALMRFDDYVEAVAEAFRLLARGGCQSPIPTEIPAQHGNLPYQGRRAAARSRLRGGEDQRQLPLNKARHGLPTIQGAVYLADAGNGRALALLDSGEITLQRTGAATAVAARYLARKDATTATICGCGEQGRIQLTALLHVCNLRTAFAWDAMRRRRAPSPAG